MRRFTSLSLFSVVCAFGAHGQATRPTFHPSPTHLAGVVVDTTKVPIAFAHVQFTGKNGQFESETKVDGWYSLRLPEGEYSVEITAKGFCTHAQRLSIASGRAPLSKDFALLECSECPPMDVDFAEPSIGTDGTAPHFPDFSKLPSMKYQVDDLRDDTTARTSKKSVLFGRRDESGDTVEYVGLFCPGYDKPPIFMFDGGNIKANKFIYSRDTKTLKGIGNVVVDEENGISRGGTVEIRLSQGRAQVSLVK